MESEEGPAKLSDICRLMNRVRELDEDHKRLMRELEKIDRCYGPAADRNREPALGSGRLKNGNL